MEAVPASARTHRTHPTATAKQRIILRSNKAVEVVMTNRRFANDFRDAPPSFPGGWSLDGRSGAKYEIDRADHAQPGPNKIEFDRLAHVEDGKRRKYRQCDDLLHDL